MRPSKLAPSRAIDHDPPRFASIHRDHGNQRNNNQQTRINKPESTKQRRVISNGHWPLATGN